LPNLCYNDLVKQRGKGDKRNAERLGDVEQRYGFRIFPYKATSHKKIQKNKKKFLTNKKTYDIIITSKNKKHFFKKGSMNYDQERNVLHDCHCQR